MRVRINDIIFLGGVNYPIHTIDIIILCYILQEKLILAEL